MTPKFIRFMHCETEVVLNLDHIVRVYRELDGVKVFVRELVGTLVYVLTDETADAFMKEIGNLTVGAAKPAKARAARRSIRVRAR